MRSTMRSWERCVLAAALAGFAPVGCVGEDGPTGPAGERGPAGPVGPEGESGTDGLDGADGADGADGEDGAQGADGADGTDGAAGADGADGADGAQGPAGAPGAPGTDGADGVDGRTPLLRLLDGDLGGWAGDNRERLNQMLQDYGASSASFDPEHRPVAVFDWDNTVIKNDIGDATMFWLIRNDKILQPPNRDWSLTNQHLTTEARAALNAACDGLAEPGQPLPTSTSTACADEIVHIYSNEHTMANANAWDSQKVTSTINQPYAWVAQLLSGYRPQQVREFAEAALWENLDAEQDAPQLVGTHSVTGWIRYYEQIRDLIGALQDNGFDVWVVSASPQNVVEPAAAELGIRWDHVVGIRTVREAGVLTYDLQGCGDVADGDNTLITFDRGKRCWINKVIYREPADSQMATNANLEHRPVFVAGDSDTDIAMLKDSVGLKLVLNRNKLQIMCNAYASYGDSWLVNPMFIEPKSCRQSPYACSTGVDYDGNPIVDEVGNAIADQADAVCLLP